MSPLISTFPTDPDIPPRKSQLENNPTALEPPHRRQEVYASKRHQLLLNNIIPTMARCRPSLKSGGFPASSWGIGSGFVEVGEHRKEANDATRNYWVACVGDCGWVGGSGQNEQQQPCRRSTPLFPHCLYCPGAPAYVESTWSRRGDGDG
ncbi:uncharacterized protein [Physcomitrium patens]|uniref:uncharacterized protein n=1 Tax=Physcomitrium patens TaxID=3218 RepID=UPI003CCCD905